MMSFLRKKKSIIIRSQHHHQLSYHKPKTNGSAYKCSGCEQPGFGSYYSRNSDGRSLDYHPRCSQLLSPQSSPAAPVGNHPPYPTGDLELKVMAPRKVRPCVACGDGVQMLRYKWRPEKAQGLRNTYWRLYRHLINRAFHPLCASLPEQIRETGEHGIVLELMERIRGECLICKGNSKGRAYNSTTGNYCFHVRCMKEKIMESLPEKEASRKNKVTIYVKKALLLVLEIAKVALRLIAGALFGFPSAYIDSIIIEVLEL